MTSPLRQYIRLIVEAAVSGAQASKHLALYRKTEKQFTQYVLYDPSTLEVLMEDPGWADMTFSQDVGTLIKGYVQAMKRHGMCNDATQISVAAAEKGYGPLMYDIVMSDSEGGIMPDRTSTSGQAKRVWQQYEKRPDVTTHKFDDKDDPKTPPKEDDCLMVDDELLDQSFDGVGQGPAKATLLQNHEDTMDMLQGDRRATEGHLFMLADRYFTQRYRS